MKALGYLIAVALALAAIWVAYQAGYDTGVAAEQARVQKAVDEFRAREGALLQELEEAKKNTRVVYRDRIKVVKEATGPCLDERLPDALLSSLRNEVRPD